MAKPQSQEMGLPRKLQGGPLCRIGFQAGMVVRELQSPGCRECWDLKIYVREKHRLRKQSFETSETYKIHNTFRTITQQSSKIFTVSLITWLQAVFVNVILAFSMSAAFLIEVLHLQTLCHLQVSCGKAGHAWTGSCGWQLRWSRWEMLK